MCASEVADLFFPLLECRPMLVMPDTSRTVGSDLRKLFREDQIKDDRPTKTAYAVDASMYRMEPQAVALVESEDDIHRLLRYAVARGIPALLLAHLHSDHIQYSSLRVLEESRVPIYVGEKEVPHLAARHFRQFPFLELKLRRTPSKKHTPFFCARHPIIHATASAVS